MTFDPAIEIFSSHCVQNIDSLRSTPAALKELGYVASNHIPFSGDAGVQDILMTKVDTAHAFSYQFNESGSVDNCALVLPDTTHARSALMTFVNERPNLEDVTKETVSFLSFAPSEFVAFLVKGQFWRSKEQGETGMNFGLLPSPHRLPSDTPAISLSVERNLSLEDPLSDENRIALLSTNSKFGELIETLKTVGLTHAPDVQKIIKNAESIGYKAKASDGGGYWLLSPTFGKDIQLNLETDCSFEFALRAELDSRLTPEEIRNALYSSLSADPKSDEFASIGHNGYSLKLSLLEESRMFGYYYFILQH